MTGGRDEGRKLTVHTYRHLGAQAEEKEEGVESTDGCPALVYEIYRHELDYSLPSPPSPFPHHVTSSQVHMSAVLRL